MTRSLASAGFPFVCLRVHSWFKPLLLAALTLTTSLHAKVTVADLGASVRLDNGIVSVEIAKANGYLLKASYKGTSTLASPGYLDWQSNGNNHLAGCAYTLVVDPAANGGKHAEIRLAQPANARTPFDVALHFVLRDGEPGLYAFATFEHRAGAPAGGIGQSRWVLRMDDTLYDTIAVDDARIRLMPPSDTPTKAVGPKESLRFESGPFKGEVTDKYHFFVDAGAHFVHGWVGSKSKQGAWIINGSRESQNGGPTKQHNAAHFGRMLFDILTCGHYGATSVSVPAGEPWAKIYGPWLLYFNAGGDPKALWADANQRAAAERAAWPYAWMRHPLYPLAAARGAVTGQLKLTDPQAPALKASGAWVGLALPAPDWQKQANGYQYWTRADADGRFTIPHVRPGSYTLYAFTSGVMEEFRRDEIVVTAGAPLDLGAVAWTAERHGKQLWQIGTPDRTAQEFRHGDDHRRWGLWQEFPKDFPNGVAFTIGKSVERTDWNFAQVNVPAAGAPGKWSGTTWNVLFDLPAAPAKGTATLRLGLASAHNANLVLSINGRVIDTLRTHADNAMIRAGNHGQYALEDIPFDATWLKPGRNTLSLQQTAAENVQKSVMYDALRLELDETKPYVATPKTPRRTPASPATAASPALDADDD